MNTPNEVSIRDQILSFFDPSIASSIIEFAKYIARIDTDFVICMARKSARLLDLLALAGCPTPKRPLVYHYVLEQDLSRFSGKTVTLLDDTLILGTTLGRAYRTLLEAGASRIDTVVFSVDQQYWDSRLINPTKYFNMFNHNEMLSFCSSEVQAFSAFSVPYLTDFPFSDDLKLTQGRFTHLQGIPFWDTHPLTNSTQQQHAVASFSVLPFESRIQTIDETLGEAISSNALAIAKIRLYARRDRRGAQWIKVIPVCTIRPLNSTNIDRLFDSALSNIEQVSGEALNSISKNLTTPRAKLRFSQYVVSGIVGQIYLNDLTSITGIAREPSYSAAEAARLFGQWNVPDINICHSTFKEILSRGISLPRKTPKLRRSKIPLSVLEVTDPECEEFVTSGHDTDENQTLESKLAKIFLKLHEKYEIPARHEARDLGEEIFQSRPEDSPHRDRLSFGFSWQTIATTIIALEGLKPTPHRIALLSLLLDRLIDAGVAVPILCEREGVFFRAYRHGEDVPFANQEYALAYDVAKGFLDGSQRVNIPRIEMEKLLVALLHVGTLKHFLIPTHGLHGSGSGIVRVGYHLHGAVVTFPTGDSPLAEQQSSWLSRRLVNEGVLRRDKTGLYTLASRPEAATLQPTSGSDAEQLGYVIGLLETSKDEAGNPILSTNDFVSLTTCSRPRDTALALTAELKIIHERLNGALRSKLETASGNYSDALDLFLADSAYIALQSARMKIRAWRTSRSRTVVRRCAEFLSTIPTGPFLKSYWLGLWHDSLQDSDKDQLDRFSPWIDKLEEEINLISLAFSVIEMALVSGAMASKNDQKLSRFRKATEKAEELLQEMSDVSGSRKLISRMQEIVSERTPIERYSEALQFGLQHVNRRTRVVHALIQQVIHVAHDFGRADAKRNFQYAVWYDIVDSTGQKSGLKGDKLRLYRNRVRDFKQHLTERIFELQRDGVRRDITLYSWSNTLSAKDDEKNIFLYGRRCLDILADLIEVMINETASCKLRIRVLVVDADFAGAPPYKYFSDPEVEGEAFWEHGSRLKARLKAKEDEADNHSSYLWLADKTSKTPKYLVSNSNWLAAAQSGEILTEIENFPLKTRFFGGKVRTV